MKDVCLDFGLYPAFLKVIFSLGSFTLKRENYGDENTIKRVMEEYLEGFFHRLEREFVSKFIITISLLSVKMFCGNFQSFP